MTCINWVRVRKGARPARFAAGDRAEAHDRRLCDGELVDLSLFVCFVIFIFTREAPTDPSSRKKEQVLIFFLSFLMENSGNRVSNCVTLGVASGAVDAAPTRLKIKNWSECSS